MIRHCEQKQRFQHGCEAIFIYVVIGVTTCNYQLLIQNVNVKEGYKIKKVKQFLQR